MVIKRARTLAAIAFVLIASFGPCFSLGAAPVKPSLAEEPMSDFADAARSDEQAASVGNLDPTKYRAFRYLNPERVLIGAAVSISVTADGKIDIVQAPGTVLTVRPNSTHQTLSHLALKRDGYLDQSLLRK